MRENFTSCKTKSKRPIVHNVETYTVETEPFQGQSPTVNGLLQWNTGCLFTGFGIFIFIFTNDFSRCRLQIAQQTEADEPVVQPPLSAICTRVRAFPPPFDGIIHRQEWIIFFDICSDVNRWTDHENLQWLRLRLIGPAGRTIRRLPGSATSSFDVAKAALTEALRMPGQRLIHEMTFRSRKKSASESWTAHAEALLSLAYYDSESKISSDIFSAAEPCTEFQLYPRCNYILVLPVSTYQQKNYVENFVQCLLDGGLAGRKEGATLVVSTIMIGQFGVMTTPAISLAIRDHKTDGGIVISAGRTCGGRQGLFGIKLCLSNGGPADDAVNARIYRLTKTIKEYYMCTKLEVKLNRVGEQVVRVGAKGVMRIIVFDSVKEYGKCMQRLFDFWQMRALFSGSITGNPVRLMIDGRNGVLYIERKDGIVLLGVPNLD
ncbi:hypothetical protein M513_10230 [Trichuris suis]|uniref:Alpha-D-phosphohexomutase alpha/beta/alpha domain-containing protein n=1 Tax=Trichuris suis TaxID=68888 RepID=A0A085LV71_9BILA|nr:hypothetical protein M513_10230 [Trichuris suis]